MLCFVHDRGQPEYMIATGKMALGAGESGESARTGYIILLPDENAKPLVQKLRITTG